MPATQNIEAAKGYDLSSALTKKRFVKRVSGTDPLEVEQCDTQGERASGVSMFSVSDSEILRGKGASIIESGIAILEASATVNSGDLVTTDVDGRAMVATTGDVVLGECREPAAAATNECSVRLGLPGYVLA